MSTWRERFLTRFGPGVLAGITLGDWTNLLRENHFSVDPEYFPRAILISYSAAVNSVFRWFEEMQYGAKWRHVTVQPPLFVLGHWRSGTTHLHYLLGLDDRFACPHLFAVHYPHTFLSTERWFSGLTEFLLPRHRPYDNVRLDVRVPDEDEFALCVSGFMTSILAGVFPRRTEHYDQFLTFRNAPPKTVAIWKSSLHQFFQKLTFQQGKPLIIKSPPHTGRIKLLLEMYPDARFVHIHRNPYAVFPSFVHTIRAALPYGRLQRTGHIDWTERIIRQYQELHEAFFEERSLIPAGRFHEMGYEELEQDPVGELSKLYAALELPEFSHVEAKVQNYIQSLSTYRKNSFPDLAPDVRQRVGHEWRRCFEEWGYPI